MSGTATVLLGAQARALVPAHAQPYGLRPVLLPQAGAALDRALKPAPGPAGSFLFAADAVVGIDVLPDPGAVSATSVHPTEMLEASELGTPSALFISLATPPSTSDWMRCATPFWTGQCTCPPRT